MFCSLCFFLGLMARKLGTCNHPLFCFFSFAAIARHVDITSASECGILDSAIRKEGR